MTETTNSNWWIWKVFWILLAITTFEVALGIIKPSFLAGTQFLGTSLLNHIFIIMTLVKAGYIVMQFMHLGHETKSFRWTVLLPIFVLIPYLLWLVLVEGAYSHLMM
ncbi:MAG: cytochrome C oxidase subunit IV family protein [Flavobacteriales bacterium]|nr:cytochrome C oxidase subunit IV family protein [Flavobacteriales bacterium]